MQKKHNGYQQDSHFVKYILSGTSFGVRGSEFDLRFQYFDFRDWNILLFSLKDWNKFKAIIQPQPTKYYEQ